MLRALLFGLVSITFAGHCLAQDFPKPGKEHEMLAQLAGEWDATMEMNGQKSKCTAMYKSICGGMWLASDFQGMLGDIKFQGHGLDGYDLKKRSTSACGSIRSKARPCSSKAITTPRRSRWS